MIDAAGLAAFYAVFVLAISSLATWVAALILHVSWPRRLREAALREPYFSPVELAVTSSFPLSLWRTLALALLIAQPRLTGKRFGDLDVRPLVGQPWIALSHLLIGSIGLGALSVIIVFAGAIPFVLVDDEPLPLRLRVGLPLAIALLVGIFWHERAKRRASARQPTDRKLHAPRAAPRTRTPRSSRFRRGAP